MNVSKISYSPNFQAKLIICDDSVQRFVKSSFLAESKNTFSALDEIGKIYPDSVVSLGIKNIDGSNYLFAKNCLNGAIEKFFLHNINMVCLEDLSVFVNLIRKIIKNEAFWTKASK